MRLYKKISPIAYFSLRIQKTYLSISDWANFLQDPIKNILKFTNIFLYFCGIWSGPTHTENNGVEMQGVILGFLRFKCISHPQKKWISLSSGRNNQYLHPHPRPTSVTVSEIRRHIKQTWIAMHQSRIKSLPMVGLFPWLDCCELVWAAFSVLFGSVLMV